MAPEHDDDTEMKHPEFWLRLYVAPFEEGDGLSDEEKEALALWTESQEDALRPGQTFLRHPKPGRSSETTEQPLFLPPEYYEVDAGRGHEVVVRHKGTLQQEIYRGRGPVLVHRVAEWPKTDMPQTGLRW